MKKLVLTYLAMAGLGASAQQAIPNGNFETWNTTTYSNPQFYSGNSNNEVMRENLPFNCERITNDVFHGTSALRLTSVSNANEGMFGYIINSDPNGDPESWHGGIPYTEKPTGIRGYYKSDVKENDTASVFVAFSKAGINIGIYAVQFYGVHSTYTLFEQIFDPALSETPDSMIFGAISSNAFADFMVTGSMLQLDSISLTGVIAQPAKLNGDFELWENITIEEPVSWLVEANDRDNGLKRITTAYKGNSAIELATTSDYDDDGGNLRARNMNISTGYYPRNCDQCNQEGGYPFTNTNDTLEFWYKYTSAANSKAEVWVTLKKFGMGIIGGTQRNLGNANTYQYVQIPLNTMLAPDTLIVTFQSSRWDDSLASQIGAKLIVDEVQLKSQPLRTGLSKVEQQIKMAVYPNPSTGIVNVDANIDITTIEIINMLGEKVYSKFVQSQHTQMDISNLPKGAYFYKIYSESTSVKTGKIMLD